MSQEIRTDNKELGELICALYDLRDKYGAKILEAMRQIGQATSELEVTKPRARIKCLVDVIVDIGYAIFPAAQLTTTRQEASRMLLTTLLEENIDDMSLSEKLNIVGNLQNWGKR